MNNENLIQFLQAAIHEKPSDAYESFDDEMLNRVSALLDERSEEVASLLFQSNGE